MFRTADAVGVKKIYICGYSPSPTIEKVAKTALGAHETIPWEQHKQTWRLIKKLKKEGVIILALEQHKKSINIFMYEVQPHTSYALIVGNEVKGINKTILDLADHIIEIPMAGKKESLNVSVATGIALYQLIQ